MAIAAQHYHALPYHPESTLLFNKIQHLPYAVFLDSCHPFSAYGRYDILTAMPFQLIKTEGAITTLFYKDKKEIITTDPFLLIKQQMANYKAVSAPVALPFHGGAIGLFGYDLMHYLEKVTPDTSRRQDDMNLPELIVGLYDWAIVVDHLQKQSHLIHAGFSPTAIDEWQQIQYCLASPQTTENLHFKVISPVTSNFDSLRYTAAFEQIQAHIKAGDCYQINLAQRFQTSITGSAYALYQQLRQKNAAPFAAYLNFPEATILSLSPERFIKVEDKHVSTKPIKGTKPRGLTPQEDKALAASLVNSLKDRAENLMIVDLLRNDLGKNCTVGSIAVPELFALESFSAVHHLVSTITGELAPPQGALDVLRGAFPGGSITGAPKIRAMQIIEQLEPHRRHAYCGAIGYIDYNGNMDTNITIRTLICQQQQVYFWAGGGIVADSVCASEYQETLDKVAKIIECLSYT